MAIDETKIARWVAEAEAGYVPASRLDEALAERDRARALAAKLEEVVAMRTAVVEALVAWRSNPVVIRSHGYASAHNRDPLLEAIIEWAHAQLQEIP